jgi:hypothetical protein
VLFDLRWRLSCLRMLLPTARVCVATLPFSELIPNEIVGASGTRVLRRCSSKAKRAGGLKGGSWI